MKNQVKRISATTCLLALEAILLWTVNGAEAALQRPLAGTHVPAIVQRLKTIGKPDANERMRLAISLPLRNPQGWDALLKGLYDPASPNYRHFLTPAQVAEQFGPTVADYQSVEAFAKANGLTIVGEHPNRLIVDVEGPVASVEKAFHTTIQNYQHPTENRTFYAPTVEPTLDLATPVLQVVGLDNYYRPQSLMQRGKVLGKRNKNSGGAGPSKTANGVTALLGSGPGGTYMGNDFRAAYMPGVSLQGNGQSVALVEFDGFFPSDIAEYESQASLPQVPLPTILIDGFSGIPGANSGEVTLDIDMAVAMAPGLDQVLVYESGFDNLSEPLDQFNRIATDDLAEQISMSWGSPFFDEPAVSQIFQVYAAQGQSFFAGSGDSGAFAPTFNGSLDSDNPYITLVGGTTLSTSGPGGSYVSETVWNWSTVGEGSGAGGGGISPTFPLPTWQQGVADAANLGSTQFRNVPDVALTADNIYVIADDGIEQSVGGTSAATPLWAAFMSLVNEQGKQRGDPPIGFPNPVLYEAGKSFLYESLFHDITTGNNTNEFGGAVDYPAVVGYDLTTGWGSPTPSLIDLLTPKPVAPVLLVYSNSVTGGNGNGKIDPGECNDLLITVTNAGPIAATGVEGVLVSETYPAVSLGQSVVTFPNVPAFSSVTASAPFTVSSASSLACGTPIRMGLTLKTDQGTFTNEMIFTNGVEGSPDRLAWTPPGPSFAPPTIPIGFSGGLSVSTNVNGLQTLAKVTVSVDISALYDAGLTIQLISPNGTIVNLASGDGGLGSDFGIGCDPTTSCTFDDNAPAPVGAGVAPFIGNYSPDEPLSVFRYISGTDLNGPWTLHILDEFPGDTATLNCWALTLTPYVCPPGTEPCPGSDLGVAVTPVGAAVANSNYVCLVTATNSGTSDATQVVVALDNTPGTGVVVATNLSQGTVTFGSGGASWNVGSLPVGGSVSGAFVMLPTVPEAPSTTTATIGSPASDPNLANNTAAATVLVQRPGADLGVSMTAAPAPVLENGTLVYSIAVTNYGPFTAHEVALTTLIPGVNFISATTTQGTVTDQGAVVQIGSLTNGGGCAVTLEVSPTAVGFVTATATATLSQSDIDPVQANNSVSLKTEVDASSDLGVSAYATPTITIAGSNVMYVATITNRGPNNAEDVTFTHLFPLTSRFVSTSISGPSVQTNANSLVWTIGVLNSGASQTVTTILAAPTNVAPGAPPVISTFTVAGQPGDPNTNNNVAVVVTVNSNAFLKVAPAGMTLLTGATLHLGDTNVTVDFVLRNAGNVPTSDLTATLLATNGMLTPSPAGPVVFGPNGILPAGAQATNRFTFAVAPDAGSTVTAVLALENAGAPLGTASFVFTMPVVTTFSNLASIDIPDKQYVPLPDMGPANPYPSAITVSDMDGLIAQVSVTVSNLTHSNPNDISMLLVSPNGLKTLLMASNALGSSVSNATITFTPDTNAPLLPQFGAIVTGSYRPTSYNPAPYFAAPAPTNAPMAADLTVFDGPGTAANGVWSLYIYDEGQGDAGNIAGGWSLSFETITPVNQVADLAVSVAQTASQAVLNGTDTFTVTVTNKGPNATTVMMTNALPAGLTVASSSLAATISGGGSVYDLGLLEPGYSVTFTQTVTVTAAGAGLLTNTFGVFSSEATVYDSEPADNAGSAIVTAILPVADVVGLTTAPATPVVQGASELYTLVVSNAGPQVAKAVTGTFSLAGLTGVSASPAGVIIGQGVATYSFGDLAVSNVGTVQITGTPTNLGVFSNAWTVSTVSQDPVPGNNTAWLVTTNLNPQPIIVGGPAILLTTTTNGTIYPGQPVTVSMILSNAGYSSTTNLVAQLLATPGVQPDSSAPVSYGQIAPDGTAAESFTLTLTGAPGATNAAVLAVSEAGGASYGYVTNTFVLPNERSFSNPAVIVIPDQGPANPYPSIIPVSGMSGLVTKVTATLHGFAHSFPRDVNVLLQSPSGQTAMLMAHTGGPYGISNAITLTFDDTASVSLPTTQLTSGTYLGTELPPVTALPGFATPTYDTSLGIFNGSNPNGNWKLYVDDDAVGNDGVINGGWSLDISAVTPVNPIARLGVTVGRTPKQAVVGAPLTYQITVTNYGPAEAVSSTVTATLSPANVAVGAVSLPPSEYSVNNNVLTANLGTIAPGTQVSFSAQVTPSNAGFLTNTLVATTASSNPFASATLPTVDVAAVAASQAKWAVALSGGNVQLTLSASAGLQYIVQTSTNLVSWTSVSTNTAGVDGTITVTDQTTNAPERFYRAIYAPQ